TDHAVDARAHEAVAARLLKHVTILALASAHHGRHDEDAAARRVGQHDVDDLLDRLPRNLAPAVGAVWVADARVEQPQVVVDLRDGADGGARVARGRLLVDRDGRGKPVDLVDVRLLHLPQELARIGRERLDVAALALGEDGIEGQTRLARARQAGEDDQPLARDDEVDVLQVVLAGAANGDGILGHGMDQYSTKVLSLQGAYAGSG